MAQTCEFGTFLNEALRDKYVVGMRTEKIQKRLLAEDKLTLTKAQQIAQGMEAAARDAKQFKESPPVVMNITSPKSKEVGEVKENAHVKASNEMGRGGNGAYRTSIRRRAGIVYYRS